MYSLISYLSENLYALIVVVTIIALVVFFIIGSIRQKQNERLMEEKRKEGEINAPSSRKKFVQGEVIEKSTIKVKGMDEENS